MNREEKMKAHTALRELNKAILALNGPYNQMKAAFDAYSEAYGAIIEDEHYTNCEGCDEPIFESEMESAASLEDGGWACASCVARWNEPRTQDSES